MQQAAERAQYRDSAPNVDPKEYKLKPRNCCGKDAKIKLWYAPETNPRWFWLECSTCKQQGQATDDSKTLEDSWTRLCPPAHSTHLEADGILPQVQEVVPAEPELELVLC